MIKPPTPPHNFEHLMAIVQALLGPEGCPWDKAQTHKSLARYTIEEAYEFVDAIESEDPKHMTEELGDLLFQVALHAELARINNKFNIDDVLNKISSKMIERHPHVFSDTKVDGVNDVLQNWEQLKSKEKSQKRKPLFDFPKDLPALMVSQKIGEKTERVKFDWSNETEVLEKVDEELLELKHALSKNNKNHIQEELGDLIFSLVQLARHLQIDAEQCVRESNKKFTQRYQHMIDQCQKQGQDFAELSPKEKEILWHKAKTET